MEIGEYWNRLITFVDSFREEPNLNKLIEVEFEDLQQTALYA